MPSWRETGAPQRGPNRRRSGGEGFDPRCRVTSTTVLEPSPFRPKPGVLLADLVETVLTHDASDEHRQSGPRARLAWDAAVRWAARRRPVAGEAVAYRQALGASDDPVEQLAGAAVAYVRFAAEAGAGFDVIYSGEIDTSEHPDLCENRRALASLLLAPAFALAPSSEQAIAARRGTQASRAAGRRPSRMRFRIRAATTLRRALALPAERGSAPRRPATA
jgi:hypothetical protein